MAITIATYGIYDIIFDLKFISAHVWDKTVDTTEILHATLDNITKGSQVIVQKYMNLELSMWPPLLWYDS